jgi:hypothetical protein
MATKLYEIVAHLKYAVVVAATSKEDALKQIELWEQCWHDNSDFIGVSDVEVTDVRKVDFDTVYDDTHEITHAAKDAIEEFYAAK